MPLRRGRFTVQPGDASDTGNQQTHSQPQHQPSSNSQSEGGTGPGATLATAPAAPAAPLPSGNHSGVAIVGTGTSTSAAQSSAAPSSVAPSESAVPSASPSAAASPKAAPAAAAAAAAAALTPPSAPSVIAAVAAAAAAGAAAGHGHGHGGGGGGCSPPETQASARTAPGSLHGRSMEDTTTEEEGSTSEKHFFDRSEIQSVGTSTPCSASVHGGGQEEGSASHRLQDVQEPGLGLLAPLGHEAGCGSKQPAPAAAAAAAALGQVTTTLQPLVDLNSGSPEAPFVGVNTTLPGKARHNEAIQVWQSMGTTLWKVVKQGKQLEEEHRRLKSELASKYRELVALQKDPFKCATAE